MDPFYTSPGAREKMRKVNFNAFTTEESEPLSPPTDNEAAAARNNTTMWSVDLTARQTSGISPRSKYIQKAEEGFETTPSSWQKEEEVEQDGESDLKPNYNGRSSYSRVLIQYARQNRRKIVIGTGLIAIFGAVITFGASKTIQTKSMAGHHTEEFPPVTAGIISGKSGKATSAKAGKAWDGIKQIELGGMEFMTEEPTSPTSNPSSSPTLNPTKPPSVPPTAVPTSVVTKVVPIEEEGMETIETEEETCIEDGWPCRKMGVCFNECCSANKGEGKGWFRCPGENGNRYCGDIEVYESTHCVPKPTKPPSVPPTAVPTSVVTKVVPIEEEGMETIETEEETCIEDGWPCRKRGVCFNECCSANKGEGKGWFRCPGENGNRYCGDIEVYESTHCVPKPTKPPSVPPTAVPTSVVTKVVPIDEEGMETIETEEEACIEDGWPCSNEMGSNEMGVCFNECCSANKGEGKGWFRCPGENGNRYCGDIEVYESTHCVHN